MSKKNRELKVEEKLLKLFYSGESANDLLAFEIVKQLEDYTPFKFALISLLFSKNFCYSKFQEEVLEFLEPNLNAYQTVFFRDASFIYVALGRGSNKGHFVIRMKGRPFRDLESIFTLFEISNIFYFLVKRGNLSPEKYLEYPNKGHSKRKEMVDYLFQFLYVKKEKDKRKLFKLDLSILYPDEIEGFMKKVLEHNQSKKEVFNYLSRTFEYNLNEPTPVFHHIKLENEPKNNYIKTRGTNYFPQFLSLYDKETFVRICLSNVSDLPTDWSPYSGLKKLIIEFDVPCTISDFNFLNTIPNIEKVEIISNGIRFSHPEIFLQARDIRISVGASYYYLKRIQPTDMTLKFLSTKGFPTHLGLNHIWLNAANQFKKSNLSYQRQIKYLKKFSVYKGDAVNGIVSSLDEIKELLEEKVICLVKDQGQIKTIFASYGTEDYGEEYLKILEIIFHSQQN